MSDVTTVAGQGGTGKVTDPMLAELCAALEEFSQPAYGATWIENQDVAAVRHCRWSGQGVDTLKHADNNDGNPVEPFEGALDQRVRYADMVANEKVMLCVLAGMRANFGVVPVEGTDAQRAANIEILRRYLVRNVLGAEYVRELIKLANYVFGDEPGVGRMRVTWRRETALRMQRLTPAEVAATWVGMQAQMGGAQVAEEELQQAAAAFEAALVNGELPEDGVAEMVRQFFPNLKPGRALKVVRQMRTEGVAEFPEPWVRFDGPEVRAQRLGSEFVVPVGCPEFQRAPMYFEPCWLSKTQVVERKVSEGWSDEFVAALVGPASLGSSAGASPATQGSSAGLAGVAAITPAWRRAGDGTLVGYTPETYRRFYQVVYAYFEATNEDDVPGRYYTVIHPQIPVAAHDWKLVDLPGGKWAGHVFQREVLSDLLMDSRGITGVAAHYQNALKTIQDNWGHNAQLSGVPPIVTRNRRDGGQLYIGPLVELRARRDGDFRWLDPPRGQEQTAQMVQALKIQADEYFGRSGAQVPEWLQRLHDEFTVMWWLTNVVEVQRQLVQQAQTFMTPEMLGRITNERGEALNFSKEDIAGQFDIRVVFEARSLDPNYLAALGGFVKDVLVPLDRQATIDTAPIVSVLLWQAAPALAEMSIKTVDRAADDELKAEWENYVKILGGVEPERRTDAGANYELRLGMYRQMQQANPQVFDWMPEDRRLILENHIKYLAQQVEQYGANAQTGREGAPRLAEAGGEGQMGAGAEMGA